MNEAAREPLSSWKRHPIRLLWRDVDVSGIRAGLGEHPELWNQHRLRTKVYQHSQVDDIWVRYNPLKNFDAAGGLEQFNKEHDAEWYPAADRVPALKQVALDVMRMVEGTRLGGVLVTRIPPRGQVLPHVDRGWHAEYYDKFAVQIAAFPGQEFCFKEKQLRTRPGDIYTFDNSLEHWVSNPTDFERITLIVCVRVESPRSLLWVKETPCLGV